MRSLRIQRPVVVEVIRLCAGIDLNFTVAVDVVRNALRMALEISAVPFHQFRHFRRVGADVIAHLAVEKVDGLVFELGFEGGGFKGFVAKLGAAHRGAHEGKVDTRLVEFLADDGVFDVVEVVGLAFDFYKFNVPGGVDAVNAAAEVFDRFHRIIADDEADGEGVVRVNPIGEALVGVPVFLVRVVTFQDGEVFVKRRAVGDEALVIHHAVAVYMLLEQGGKFFVGHGFGIRIDRDRAQATRGDKDCNERSEEGSHKNLFDYV